MGLPKVQITIKGGGLGRVPTINDGITGLLIRGNKVTASLTDTNKAYKTSQLISSVADFEALAESDTSLNSSDLPDLHEQVQDFYNQTGRGSELWLLLLATDDTFESVFAVDGKADKLIEASQGRVRLLGISHYEGGDTPTAESGGFTGNLHGAVNVAQQFALRQQSSSRPLSVLIAGNSMDTDLSKLTDYAGGSSNRVSLLISGKKAESKQAALGLLLGNLSLLPVQRSLARVKNGALPISTATLTSGVPVEEYAGTFSTLHDKRYIFFRNYTGLAGYYVSDDLTLTSNTDDNATISLGRTIDKVLRLAYVTYIEELAEEILLDDGKLSAAHVKYLEAKIENVVNETMTNKGEVSGFSVFIDPEQNILSTSELNVDLRVTPVGYAKTINITIGFINPQS